MKINQKDKATENKFLFVPLVDILTREKDTFKILSTTKGATRL